MAGSIGGMSRDLVRSVLPPVHGILYAEDFDDLSESRAMEVEPDALPPEPTFSADELEAAQQRAAAAARAEARASAEMEAWQARGATLAEIATGLARLRDDVAAEVGRATDELTRAVLSVLCAALPSLMAATARREVSALLERLLPGLRGEARVTVRVHPLLAPTVADDLARLDEDGRGSVELVPAEALAPGDLRVSWHEGRLVRDTAAIHRTVQDMLRAAGLEQPPLGEIAHG